MRTPSITAAVSWLYEHDELARLINTVSTDNLPVLVITRRMPHDTLPDRVVQWLLRRARQKIANILDLSPVNTGNEYVQLVEGTSAPTIKSIAMTFEENDPFGMLIDIDVFQYGVPLTRSGRGAPARHCLVCDKPAKYCISANSHPRSILFWSVWRYFFTAVIKCGRNFIISRNSLK